MTAIVQVKKKAQVTLPREVREKLEIREGDILEVEVQNEAIVLRPRQSDRITLRPVSANSLQGLTGLISAGGDALQESEDIDAD